MTCHSHSKERAISASEGGGQGEVFITEVEDRIREDIHLDRDFINLLVQMYSLTAGNNHH